MSDSDFIKDISKSLDNILDVPAEQWSQKEINLYHLLQQTMKKYQIRYSLAQFKLDLRDIKNNVKRMAWYQESHYKKTIDWCLDQLTIKSYQRSQRRKEFKVIVKFTQVQAIVTIHYRSNQLEISLKSPLTEGQLSIKNQPLVAKIFGIDDSVPLKHKKGATLDIIRIIQEVALFYVPADETS